MGQFNILLHVLLYPRSMVTLGITGIFTLVYLLVFFLVESTGWPAFIIGVLFSIYSYAVWIFLTYRIAFQYDYAIPRSPLLPLFTFVALYVITIAHNAALYSGIATLEKNAFIGIDAPNEPRWRILYLSIFLATETLSALGTGSIFANPFINDAVGFIPIWLESIQALLMFTWIGWGLTQMAMRSGKKKLLVSGTR